MRPDNCDYAKAILSRCENSGGDFIISYDIFRLKVVERNTDTPEWLLVALAGDNDDQAARGLVPAHILTLPADGEWQWGQGNYCGMNAKWPIDVDALPRTLAMSACMR